VGVLLFVAACARPSEVVKVPLSATPARAQGDGHAAATTGDADDGEGAERTCEAVMFADNHAGAKGLFSFEDSNGLIGFRDARGRVVIRGSYRFAYEFSEEGITSAIDAGGSPIFVDTNGRVLARALLFDNGPDYFQYGYARIQKDGKVGFLDRYGRVAIEPRWDGAYSFCDGLAPVCVGCARGQGDEHDSWLGGKWGFIDVRGAIAIPLEYEEASMFHDGEAEVVHSGKWLRIDRRGQVKGPVIEDRADKKP
jgi:hypothetical protein